MLTNNYGIRVYQENKMWQHQSYKMIMFGLEEWVLYISQLLILVTHTQAENSVLTDILVYIFLKGFMTHMMFVLAGVPALF